MMEFWIDLAFSVMFTLLRGLVKDPKKREEMRKVFLKLDTLIHAAYPEF